MKPLIKIVLKDCLILLVAGVTCAILYKQQVISITQLVIGFFGLLLGILCFTLGILFLFQIKKGLRRALVLVMQFALKCKRFMQSHVVLLFKIVGILLFYYNTRVIEIIFASYVHYFRTYQYEINNVREFPKHIFPEGSYELVKVYQYITDYRHANKRDYLNIDYILGAQRVMFYGILVKSVTLKIKDGRIHVNVDTDGDPMTYDQYRAFMLKFGIAIERLDTQTATWIIANRAHLEF